MSGEHLQSRKRHLMDLLEIGPFRSRLIRQLSGGQQRRVGAVESLDFDFLSVMQVSLAVALLHEPELLILDEPTVC